MRRVTPFALLAILLFLPTWAGPPADFDKDKLKAMLAETTDYALRTEARLGVVTEKAIVVKPGAMEISVDCDAGQSVNDALGTHLSRYLTINLAGTCRETVLVERPGITLSGTLAGGAVIDPPDGQAIRALWAHELKLVDLTLTGAIDGLYALASHGMLFERVRAVDNVDTGIILQSSSADIVDAELSRNAVPIFLFNQSTASVYDSLIEDNVPWGPWVMRQSTLHITDSAVRRNGYALFASVHSHIGVHGSTVGVPGTTMWALVRFSSGVTFNRGSEVHTETWAIENSYLAINNATIGTDAVRPDLWVAYDSYLDVWGRSTVINADIFLAASGKAEIWRMDEPLRGDVSLFEFGEGYFSTGVPIDGAIVCWDGGRAICSPHPTGGIHGCD